jgi:hypothetical protein
MAHGISTRGLTLSRSSLLFSGPFGRIFRALPAADFGDDDGQSMAALRELAAAIVAPPDPIKDGPDAEESGLPAAYTYFGQFIDHDLTFDPASSLQRQDDPDALVDFRTPRFDLDNVYGRGPDDQPYLYSDGRHFLLGQAMSGDALGVPLVANDHQRSGATPPRAIIGDPRNDENVIVSQFHGLFLRFHNKLADLNPNLPFDEVQQLVRFHYQWVVLNDFLPKIVSSHVINQVLPHLKAKSNVRAKEPKLEFFHFRNFPFMPLEFSVAAYRFGHSMVRPGYTLNDAIHKLPIFDPSGSFATSLVGFQGFPLSWAIDWARFIDLEGRPSGSEDDESSPGNAIRTQLAYRIDASLVDPLGSLPPSVGPAVPSLAFRNLLRGWRLRLPSGQDVARAMGLVPLTDAQILIGKKTGDADDPQTPIDTIVPTGFSKPPFVGKCPLWTYVLAETVLEQTKLLLDVGIVNRDTYKLGPVGGRIVAETFAGLLLGDSKSYLSLDPLFQPERVKAGGVFGLREFIAFATERNPTP